MYYLAERMWHAAEARGAAMNITIITNGLLLTPEIVDRLLPFGLRGVKITLDGDRDTHNRMRPLRGGQGTFDRIIENIRRVAGRVRIAIGGNFDESSVDSYPALLEFLRRTGFRRPAGQGQLQAGRFAPRRPALKGILSLTPVNADGKPLGGTCMTVGRQRQAGRLGLRLVRLRGRADVVPPRGNQARTGFPTPDGVHNGPCHVHMKHAHTIGPDGSLYACPGFTGDLGLSTGHIDDRRDSFRDADAREQFDRLESVEGMRRLRVHPGLCGRMSGGVAHAAWRHEPADLSQAELRIGSHSLAHDVASAA